MPMEECNMGIAKVMEYKIQEKVMNSDILVKF